MFNYDELTKTLTIQFEFDDELVDLSNNIKIIIFENTYSNCSKFNKNVDNLPPNLTHLTFGYCFNKNVDKLPPNLTHLTFGFCFNKNVDNLPSNLTHLTFGYWFNQNVDKLSPNLTYLTFGVDFNQKVDKLPQNLTHLTLDFCFNQNVDKLPPNLTHLTFGHCFNQNVNNLPKKLTHLTFGKEFNQNINNLTFIKCLGFSSNSYIKNNIPDFITKIYIIFYENYKNNEYITNLPPTIQEIKINNKNKIHYLKKIPYGCIVKDENDNIIS